ncbi:hypothetical protein Fmac_021964 [Flemingia macrophylla]|uniref:Tify domain-containing protein n=1 Tax=Flemingia macrophylla TaxID=520843 RepID=A0ABD1LYC7_9FABA
MANTIDLKPYLVISKVRTGLKREFAFAMKVQSEIYASMGRTRSSMTQNVVQVRDQPKKKRYKKSYLEKRKSEKLIGLVKDKEDVNVAPSEEEVKKDVLDVEKVKNQAGDEVAIVHKSNEPTSDMVQTHMQLVCDDGIKEGHIEEGCADVAISILDCKAKHTRRFTQSKLKKLHDGDNKIENDGVEKEIAGNRFHLRLKDLLSSEILDGLHVTYVRSTKAKVTGLKGVISGNGIVCYCEACDGIEVVTPAIFELHAGSSNRRPSEHIFLENGNTLRDVMNVFSNIPLSTLEEALQRVLKGFTFKKSKFCVHCKDINVVSSLFCNSCMVPKDCQTCQTQTTETDKMCVSLAIQSRSTEANLYSKPLHYGMKQNTCRGKSPRKLTKKDLRLHKLVFEEDVLPDGTELAYYADGKMTWSVYWIRGRTTESPICWRRPRWAKSSIVPWRRPRCQYFSKSFGPQTVIICDQELPEGNWFCSSSCDEIHTTLASLVARGEENVQDSLKNVIRKKCYDKVLKNKDDFDIKWRVLNWKLDESDENEKFLSKVVAIFHERFDPIVHPTTGVDFISSMIFGQTIISAGIFRVLGLEVAELPLVATTTDYQGQGLLGSLKVKHLVLPAADEAESLWTSKFGFTKLDQEEQGLLDTKPFNVRKAGGGGL